MTKETHACGGMIQAVLKLGFLAGLMLACVGVNAQQETQSAAQQIATGRYTQALYQLARIEPAQRTDEQTLQLARCHQHLQHYDEALSTLDTLGAAIQQRLDVVLLYVDIEYAQNNLQSALKRLLAIADSHTSEPDFVLHYAQVQQALGNFESAEAAYSYYGVLHQELAQGVRQ